MGRSRIVGLSAGEILSYGFAETLSTNDGVAVAVVCLACEHIHFDTNRDAVPTHCAACGHDLSQPVTPPEPAVPTRLPVSGGRDRRPYLPAGVAVLCLSGWFLLTGVAERERYVPVTATMTTNYLNWAEVKGTADLMKGAIPGQAGNSNYVVDGRTYRTTIDRRWRLGERFEVWYLPDAPHEATEIRPYGKLLTALPLMAVGLFLIGRAFGIFGAAVEPPAESLTVPMPTDADISDATPQAPD